MQAYRTAAAGTVQKLASALFGRELLAVEAAKTSAAERERMLEERAKELFESQVTRRPREAAAQIYLVQVRGGKQRTSDLSYARLVRRGFRHSWAKSCRSIQGDTENYRERSPATAKGTSSNVHPWLT